MEAFKVLVVDDVPNNLMIMERRMTNEGYEVVLASDGKEALDKLKSVHPDLILMDLKMPVMNGIEAAAKIKADEKLSQIPIIAMSAAIKEQDRLKLQQKGFEDICLKPIKVKELLPKIDDWLIPLEEAQI